MHMCTNTVISFQFWNSNISFRYIIQCLYNVYTIVDLHSRSSDIQMYVQCTCRFSDFVQLHQDMVLPPFSKPDPPILTSLPSSPSTQNTANHHLPPPPPLLQPSKRTQPSSSSSSAHLLPPTALPTPAPKSTKRTPKGSAKRSPASRRKKDTDSNAPKKPSNAFFWFCQEQRGSMEERFRGEGVAGQHTLTKILAQKWGETSADDKKV